MELDVTTLELWPRKALLLIKDKGLSVNKLKTRFEENIIFPWDDIYDKERMLFSTQIQERPLFIIKPKSAEDVISIFNLVKNYNLSLRIVGGRHSTSLQNPDIFVDMCNFRSIKLDKYLVVEAGATQGQVNDFLFSSKSNGCIYFPGSKPNHPNDLIFPGGSAASVGVAGISTIGGIGTLRRTYGLSVDNIKYFKIVIPPKANEKAKVVKVSKNVHQDLFWALCGGGAANFGIVLEIGFKLLNVGKVLLYDITWDFRDAETVLEIWEKTATSRPNNFNEDIGIFNTENGEQGIHLTGIYVMEKSEDFRQAKQKIIEETKQLGGKLSFSDEKNYPSIYEKFVSQRTYHSFSVGKTFLTEKYVPPNVLLEALNKSKNNHGYTYIGIQLMGGKISEVRSDETAFYPRRSNFFVDIFNFWDNALYQEENMKWNGKTFNLLYPIIGPYTYLGFPIPNLHNNLYAYYGENTEKLRMIKRQIDPLKLLSFPGSL